MKITQCWKRNIPTTATGESLTFTMIYSSFDKMEIDELERNVPKGTIISEAEKSSKLMDKERAINRLKTQIKNAHDEDHDFAYIPIGTAKTILRLLTGKED